MVQLHKFGNLYDEVEPETPTLKLPSYLSMIEFAQQDGKARRTIGEERILNAAKKFSEIPEGDEDTSGRQLAVFPRQWRQNGNNYLLKEVKKK